MSELFYGSSTGHSEENFKFLNTPQSIENACAAGSAHIAARNIFCNTHQWVKLCCNCGSWAPQQADFTLYSTYTLMYSCV